MYRNKGKDECDSHLSKREDLHVEAFRQTNEKHFLILTNVLYFLIDFKETKYSLKQRRARSRKGFNGTETDWMC